MAGPRRAIAHRREFPADRLTPVEVYRRLARQSDSSFLLESVTGGEQVSRYSLLASRPREILRLYPDRLEKETAGERRDLAGEPLAALRHELFAVEASGGELPFAGGFVGYFGFDAIRLVENLPGRPDDPFSLPVAWLGRFDEALVFDHASGRVIAVANEIEGEVDRAAALAGLDRLGELLTAETPAGGGALPATPSPPVPTLEPSLDGASFRRAVETVREHIAAGDVFQTVLARRWRLPPEPGGAMDPLALYRALRMINPSPYMVLLATPEAQLVGASPEMLVRKQGDKIETRPIAGTRPRGADAAADRAQAADLSSDEKERAEHLMLVDLGRNDLGRVAMPGSVEVPTFMEIERYSHVMHLVSSLEARLAPGLDALDALFACFPAGTVSGAPKLRAIELIDELEPEARGPYAGAVGYLSFTGDLDTCITIRTLVLRDGGLSVTAGAGIVAESRPAAEERETENKAAALLAAVALARELD